MSWSPNILEEKEVGIMERLDHPNIIGLRGYTLQDNLAMVFMELEPFSLRFFCCALYNAGRDILRDTDSYDEIRRRLLPSSWGFFPSLTPKQAARRLEGVWRRASQK